MHYFKNKQPEEAEHSMERAVENGRPERQCTRPARKIRRIPWKV